MINRYICFKQKSLLELCKTENENKIVKFIDKYDNKYNPEEIDNDGNTSLIIALNRGFENVVIKLIDKFGCKCSPQQINREYKTALNYAIANGLEKSSIKIIETFDILCIPDYKINNEDALTIACSKGLSNIAIKIVKMPKNTWNLEQIKYYSNTTLFIAIRNELNEVAIELLNKIVDIDFLHKDTFKIICENKLEDIAEKILSMYNHENLYKDIYLVFSILCKNKLKDTIIKFLDMFTTEELFNNINLILIFSSICLNNLEEIAMYLVNKIKIKLLEDDSFYIVYSMILSACTNKLENVIIMLLEIKGYKEIIDYYKADKSSSFVYWAFYHKLENLILKILDNYPDSCKPQHLYFSKEPSGLLYACRYNLDKIAIKMIDILGNNCNPKDIDYDNNSTALMWAISNKMENVAIKIINKFGDKCKPENINNKYNNALFLACKNSLEMIAIKMLREFGDKCIPDSNINAVLIYACSNKLENIGLELIEKFGDRCKIEQLINITNMTLLSLACINKLENIALKLIEKFGDKCNYHNKDINSRTSYDYANIYSLQKVKKLLEITKIKKIYNYDDKKCIICMDDLNNKYILLVGCGHTCYCAECSVAINKCSICNVNIIDRYELIVK
jgi:ankyrin repeat protein